jgi:hypothetical protein
MKDIKMDTALEAISASVGARGDAGGNFAPGVVEVKVARAAELDEALHNAVALVLKTAMEHKTGILMTRMGAGRYTVQAHPEVPVGLIRQRDVEIARS